jgi:hypothetical protein
MLPLRWPAVTEAWLGKVKGTQIKAGAFILKVQVATKESSAPDCSGSVAEASPPTIGVSSAEVQWPEQQRLNRSQPMQPHR